MSTLEEYVEKHVGNPMVCDHILAEIAKLRAQISLHESGQNGAVHEYLGSAAFDAVFDGGGDGGTGMREGEVAAELTPQDAWKRAGGTGLGYSAHKKDEDDGKAP